MGKKFANNLGVPSNAASTVRQAVVVAGRGEMHYNQILTISEMVPASHAFLDEARPPEMP
jgi:hypothetical protein